MKNIAAPEKKINIDKENKKIIDKLEAVYKKSVEIPRLNIDMLEDTMQIA